MLQTILVIIAPHSDRSGREKGKKLRLPTALMRRRAIAAHQVFVGMGATGVPQSVGASKSALHRS